jgi:hypothetical protein
LTSTRDFGEVVEGGRHAAFLALEIIDGCLPCQNVEFVDLPLLCCEGILLSEPMRRSPKFIRVQDSFFRFQSPKAFLIREIPEDVTVGARELIGVRIRAIENDEGAFPDGV